jgi:hypothetical protein
MFSARFNYQKTRSKGHSALALASLQLRLKLIWQLKILQRQLMTSLNYTLRVNLSVGRLSQQKLKWIAHIGRKAKNASISMFILQITVAIEQKRSASLRYVSGIGHVSFPVSQSLCHVSQAQRCQLKWALKSLPSSQVEERTLESGKGNAFTISSSAIN